MLVDSRRCPDPWRLSAPVNSFPRCSDSTPDCSPRPVDRDRAWRSCRPPRIPDGEEVFTRWATMGVAHFGELGAEVEPVLVRDRAAADDPAAAQAIGEADLIYLSGGKPAYLLGALAGSAVGRALTAAHQRGAVLAGCSAGAMVLAGDAFDFRIGPLPWPLRWRTGLGFVPGASVVPHYDAWPEALVRPGRPAVAAPVGRPRHRRGNSRDRPRRCVAGPRPIPRHGLARAPPRTLSGGGLVPALTGRQSPGMSPDSRRTWPRRLLAAPRDDLLSVSRRLSVEEPPRLSSGTRRCLGVDELVRRSQMCPPGGGFRRLSVDRGARRPRACGPPSPDQSGLTVRKQSEQ